MRQRMLFGVLMTIAVAGLATAAGAQTTTSTVPEVTVTRTSGGHVLVEVADAGVRIRKDIGAGASHAVISTAADEVQVRVTSGQMVVSTPEGSVTVARGQTTEMAQLMQLLQRSDAAVRGLALLKRVPATSRHFGQQALLLTRAVLELGTGPSDAIAIHRREAARERARLIPGGSGRAAITRVGLAGATWQQGPGDCWDLYAKEAVRIADDFADCSEDLAWYDALGWAGCSLIYAMRAEGAMAWFIACNGGVPFQS
jgi:hypothetical protein